MTVILSIAVFLLGLIVGSFLNCFIYRTETGQSFLKGRSFCPKCKHKLGVSDLFPVFSFLLLGGRCRYCKKKISWQYPLVELATGLLFLCLFIFDFSFLYFLIAPVLVVVFVYDLKHYLIPEKAVYLAVAVAFLHIIFYLRPDFLNYLFAASGAGAFFFFIVLISKGRWMGMGDISLAFLMGLVLGWPDILVALFLAFFMGAIIGVGLILASKKSLKSEVPFGPFLVLGTFIAIFYSQQIINWYLSLYA